jgi:hypothetical protein
MVHPVGMNLFFLIWDGQFDDADTNWAASRANSQTRQKNIL